MNKRALRVAVSVLLVMTSAASAQTEPTGDEPEIQIETPVVVKAARRSDGSFDGNLLRNYFLRNYLRNYLLNNSTSSQDHADLKSHAAGFCGLERYELSPADLAFQGLGMGASMGLCAGAIGSSFGWWDEDKALLMTGAMSALGALWTATKADDPSWRYRYRLTADP